MDACYTMSVPIYLIRGGGGGLLDRKLRGSHSLISDILINIRDNEAVL